jgi:DNA-binding XRE family transcriptional regulator
MNPAKRAHLEKKGWRVGRIEEFLSLPADDAAYLELKLVLSEQVRAYRRAKQLTPAQMARLIGSSPSRVTKIESGDASVSLDLMIRSLLALGATRQELARMIAA